MTHEDREELRLFLSTVDQLARTRPLPSYVYLVVTPLGMRSQDVLERALADHGISITARVALNDWPRISTALQVRRRDPAALARAVLFERAWSTLFPDGLGEAWRIDEDAHEALTRQKTRIRATLPNLSISLEALDPGRRASLHPFHLADFGQGPEEARRLEICAERAGRSPHPEASTDAD